MYVVFGTIRVKPEHRDEFTENVRRHARNTSAEPGCVRFEVLQGVDDPNTICLFEVFRDEAAFAAHQAADYYKWWMDISKDWRDPQAAVRHVLDYVYPEQGA